MDTPVRRLTPAERQQALDILERIEAREVTSADLVWLDEMFSGVTLGQLLALEEADRVGILPAEHRAILTYGRQIVTSAIRITRAHLPRRKMPAARPRERRPSHRRRAAMRSSARSGDSGEDDGPSSSPRLTLVRPRAIYTFGVEARERWGFV